MLFVDRLLAEFDEPRGLDRVTDRIIDDTQSTADVLIAFFMRLGLLDEQRALTRDAARILSCGYME